MARFVGETFEERGDRIIRERNAARARVKKHQPEVKDVQSNGKFVTVEWTRDNGERVSASFELVGWKQAPADVVADTMERLSNPPVFLAGARGPK